ncbi:DUF1707 domain-containing protein [Streptacidiphilus sp. 4-A2]|nr:DUF1707 domain-containing protein [Streptacidiphilus sp. 4-A2]
MEKLPELRVGAVERDDAIEALSEHMATGRLTVEEFEERMGRAQSATSRSDLQMLFSDLPAPGWETGGVLAEHPRIDRLAVVAKSLLPAAGVAATALTVLTDTWYPFVVLPPVAYGVQEFIKKFRSFKKSSADAPELP